MEIIQIYTGSVLRNFSYLIFDKEKRQAYCLDPFDASQIEEALKKNNLKLEGIINTHEHPDHICGNDGLVSKFAVPIYAHKNAKNKIPGVSRLLDSKDKIKINQNEYLEIMDTPGHTFAHLCLKAVDEKNEFAVFTGDTLFNAGVGNCHNGGDPQVLYQTICSQFFSLNDEMKVYPGHEYWENNLAFTGDREPENPYLSGIREKYEREKEKGNFLVSTIEMERKVNVFFRLDQNEVKKNLEIYDNNEVQVFLKLRELRNKW